MGVRLAFEQGTIVVDRDQSSAPAVPHTEWDDRTGNDRALGFQYPTNRDHLAPPRLPPPIAPMALLDSTSITINAMEPDMPEHEPEIDMVEVESRAEEIASDTLLTEREAKVWLLQEAGLTPGLDRDGARRLDPLRRRIPKGTEEEAPEGKEDGRNDRIVKDIIVYPILWEKDLLSYPIMGVI